MHLRASEDCLPLDRWDLLAVINALEEIYSPLRTKIHKNPVLPTYEQFRYRIVRDIEWDSTPGLPYSQIYTVNRDLFGWNGVFVDDQRTHVVYAAFCARWRELEEAPVAYPISLFIKPEPHKIKKRLQKAWRIIHNVSIIDNLICRFTLGDLLGASISSYQVIPNKVGWAPSWGGYVWMANQIPGFKLMADKSAWDFTCQGWVVLAFAGLVDRLYSHIPSDGTTWRAVLGNHLAILFANCTLAIGSIRVRQRTFGVMKSGWFGTIGLNSVAQVALHVLACRRLGVSWKDSIPLVMGDDTVQSSDVPPRYIEILQKGGCIVKEFFVSDEMQFAGHQFTTETCTPMYITKHVWALLHLDPKVALDALETYQYLYALHPEMLAVVHSLLLHFGGTSRFRSADFLRSWYNGWESYDATNPPITLCNRVCSIGEPGNLTWQPHLSGAKRRQLR